ncbi:MAG: PH domain-containing protein [Balneolaceae bacterium]|nr:PH domain-containing protein [Balneolaceae bacterium]
MALRSDWLQTKLRAGEELIHSTRLHSYFFYPPILFLLLGLDFWWFLIPGALMMGYYLYQFFSNHFVITNQRVMFKKGLFYIRVKEFDLEDITDINSIQNYADRLFGSGSILLIGKTFPTEKISNISKPDVFRDALRSQL